MAVLGHFCMQAHFVYGFDSVFILPWLLQDELNLLLQLYLPLIKIPAVHKMFLKCSRVVGCFIFKYIPT